MNSVGAIGLNSSGCCGLSRQRCVTIIAVFEILGSLWWLGFFGYANWTFPAWKNYALVDWLEIEFLPDLGTDIVLGSINTLIILNGIGFLLSLLLLDGVVNVKLGRICFWITSVFTYKLMTCIFLVGMQFAGCKSPRLYTLIVINIFLSFIEILYIYGFFLEEKHKRRVQVSLYKEFLLSRQAKDAQEHRENARQSQESRTSNETVDRGDAHGHDDVRSSKETLTNYSETDNLIP